MTGNGQPNSGGWIGAIIERFLDSKLSILLLILSTILGLGSIYWTPREEEPQIIVPMADILVQYPGASAEEVEKLVATPLERLLWQIDGVEHVYSTARRDMAVVTVRFFVGEDREDSLLKLYNKIEMNIDQAPPGVTGWVVKPVEIDDVPIVTLTLTSKALSDFELHRIGQEVLSRLDSLPDLSRTYLVGGRRQEVRVEINQERLAGYGLSLLEVQRAVAGADASLSSGRFDRSNTTFSVRSGPFLQSVEEVRSLVVGVHAGKPVYLRDVATVTDGPEEAATYSRIGFGPARDHKPSVPDWDDRTTYPAVTLALAKKKGTNAVWVAESILKRIEELKRDVIPTGVEVVLTRDYGETANDKVNELIEGLVVAVITVVGLLAFTLGWREAIIVTIAIPVTYFLTLFFNMMFGYTINRVTLFALTMALGLLVDDPIVDVENIYRHFKMRLRPPRDSVLFAVNEVRPPIIMATFAVIFSFLPMFFITGMMGPYMRPMALNVPMTMLMSMVVAFTITPWLSYHFLKGRYGTVDDHGEKFDLRDSMLYRIYARVLGPFLSSRFLSWLLVLLVLLLLVGSGLLGVLRVPLKMLPFDNKNEFQLVLDLPEGTTLETTDTATRAFEDYLRTVPEVTDFISCVGTSSPMDFNGMVRHYYFRNEPNMADIRVNLVHKDYRVQQSHTIALRLRKDLETIAQAHRVNLKFVELPPGPPVISTLVAEVYGRADTPYSVLLDTSKEIQRRLVDERNVVDIDDTSETSRDRLEFRLDKEKAALHGVTTEQVVQTLQFALSGSRPARVHEETERKPLEVRLVLPRIQRSGAPELSRIFVKGMAGELVPLAELGRFESVPEDQPIYHKDLERVAYVFAEMAGRAPGEAVLNQLILEKKEPHAQDIRVTWSGEGEWQITLDVFRDLGLAFAGALVAIYILLVIETASFLMPLIIMLAIPLTMIGIMPGFYILNVFFTEPAGGFANPIFFTATAMIGMIALAGIVVRNSILLIDFILEALRQGRPLRDALLESGAVRLRPILLTAGTTLLGNWVITLDPIFSGLAWSIIFGIFASTAFTLLVIPVVYNLVYGGKQRQGDARHE